MKTFVKINRLYLPTYFIILDMEKDREVPIILGRPFLATGNILIDVQQGKLTLSVQDDEFTFNVFKVIKYPMDNKDCVRIDAVDKLTREIFREGHPTLPLEACITHSDTSTTEDQARRECVGYLEATTGFLKEEEFMELLHLPSTLVSSMQEPPKLELKELPFSLKVCISIRKFYTTTHYFLFFDRNKGRKIVECDTGP